MKKLLDETSDELTRALLLAGRSHQPPAENKAKLLMALGVGTGIGLFTSKAFAWFGTNLGKLSVLGVAVGVAGAAYTLAAAPKPGPAAAERPRVALEAPKPVSALRPELAAAPASDPARSFASPTSVPAPVADASRNPRSGPAGSSGAAPRRENAPAASGPRRTATRSRGAATRRDDFLGMANLSGPDGPLPAASEPPAVGAPEALAAPSGLELEVQAVDALRGAAARNDVEAVLRLAESYRGRFPNGQLQQEVAELELRFSTRAPAR